MKISNLTASSEHDLVVSRNYRESKENTCNPQQERTNNANKSCFDSFEYSSDMISRFSDSLCSIGDRTKDLNESDLNNINLSVNADKSLQNNITKRKQNEIFNPEQNSTSNTVLSVILNEEPTQISESKAVSNAETINFIDQSTEVSENKVVNNAETRNFTDHPTQIFENKAADNAEKINSTDQPTEICENKAINNPEKINSTDQLTEVSENKAVDNAETRNFNDQRTQIFENKAVDNAEKINSADQLTEISENKAVDNVETINFTDEPTEICENKAINNAEKINSTDQLTEISQHKAVNNAALICDTCTDKARETFSVNENEILGSKETEDLYKKETELRVLHKSLKIILRDCTEYGENFELMDQIEYGVMNFDDPDPDISENENESEDERVDFSGYANDECIDIDEIEPRVVAQDEISTVAISFDNVNGDNEVECSRKKIKMSKPSPRNLEHIEEHTLNMLRPIIDRYLSTLYIPNYYYYKHIFRCIHEDILRKKLYGNKIHGILYL